MKNTKEILEKYKKIALVGASKDLTKTSWTIHQMITRTLIKIIHNFFSMFYVSNRDDGGH